MCRKRLSLLLVALSTSVLATEPPRNAASESANTPSEKQIIEALTPMRTRSLRNLFVQPKQSVADNTSSPAQTVGDSATAETSNEPASISMSINFDFGSAHIRADSAEILSNLAAALAAPQLKTARFLIEGHTDAKGSDAFNLRLSQQRAIEVRQWLSRHGVAAERLDTVGRGSTQLADPDPLAAANRRVRIVNLE